MSIRVCANNHITGFRHCPQCGADAVRPLRDRQIPVPRHELRSGPSVGAGANPAPFSPPPFKQWRIWRRFKDAAQASGKVLTRAVAEALDAWVSSEAKR